MDTKLSQTERAAIMLMSDFFFDGMLSESDLECITRRLDEVPLTIREIEALLWDELFPVLVWNIHGAGFSHELLGFLEEYVCDWLDKRRSGFMTPFLKPVGFWLNYAAWGNWMDFYWKDVKARLIERRASLPDANERSILQLFQEERMNGHRYLEMNIEPLEILRSSVLPIIG